MPYKFETNKLKIPKKYDKRIKLTDNERKEIKMLYGKISQRKLAKMYNVSRRLIIFIGCPEKAQKNKIQRKLNGILNNHYYKKERHKGYMKKHRRYKHILYLENKLKKAGEKDVKKKNNYMER